MHLATYTTIHLSSGAVWWSAVIRRRKGQSIDQIFYSLLVSSSLLLDRSLIFSMARTPRAPSFELPEELAQLEPPRSCCAQSMLPVRSSSR